MSKIFLKIFIGFLIVIVTLTTLLILLTYYTVREQYLDNLTNHLKNLNYSIKNIIETKVDSQDYQELDNYIKKLGREIHARITVILPDGLVVADAEKDPAEMENHRTRTEIAQAINNGFGTSLRFSNTIKEDMLYVALPILKDGNIIAVSRVSMHTKDIDILYSRLRNRIISSSIILSLITLIGVFFFSLSFTKPIKSLAEASRKISAGDFDTKILLKRSDELRELADSFNDMTIKLSSSFKEIREQKEELSSLLSGLQEGFVVIDKHGKIILSNKSFNILFDKENLIGTDYWSVLQDAKVAKLIKQLKSQYRSITKEIQIADGFYICSGSYIEAKDKNILKIFDQSVSTKGLNLQSNFSENLPLIKADPFKLEQLLINLIDNAIKYTNEGTIQLNITDKVGVGSQPSPSVKNKSDNKIIIEVKDSGIGIPKDQQERIFERFYTVDKSRSKKLGGTGLGLSIVKHIVQLHNGEIKVESELGKGTRFVVSLPIA